MIEFILIIYLFFYVSVMFYGIKKGWIYLEEEQFKRNRRKNIKLVEEEQND